MIHITMVGIQIVVRWDETYFLSEVTQILVDTNADTDETIDKSDCDDSDIGYDDYINE